MIDSILISALCIVLYVAYLKLFSPLEYLLERTAQDIVKDVIKAEQVLKKTTIQYAELRNHLAKITADGERRILESTERQQLLLEKRRIYLDILLKERKGFIEKEYKSHINTLVRKVLLDRVDRLALESRHTHQKQNYALLERLASVE